MFIDTKNNTPGIRGLMNFKPKMGEALNVLAEAVLRGDSPISQPLRELMAAYVSLFNDCDFCYQTHLGIAAKMLKLDVDQMDDYVNHKLTRKERGCIGLAIESSKGNIRDQDTIDEYRKEFGLSDEEIHDGVLIGASFAMFNRYVKGLGVVAPKEAIFYEQVSEQRAKEGYLTKSVIDNL